VQFFLCHRVFVWDKRLRLDFRFQDIPSYCQQPHCHGVEDRVKDVETSGGGGMFERRQCADCCRLTRITTYTSVLTPRIYWRPWEKLGVLQKHQYIFDNRRKDLKKRHGEQKTRSLRAFSPIFAHQVSPGWPVFR
jgi:hypothetical protein